MDRDGAQRVYLSNGQFQDVRETADQINTLFAKE